MLLLGLITVNGIFLKPKICQSKHWNFLKIHLLVNSWKSYGTRLWQVFVIKFMIYIDPLKLRNFLLEDFLLEILALDISPFTTSIIFCIIQWKFTLRRVVECRLAKCPSASVADSFFDLDRKDCSAAVVPRYNWKWQSQFWLCEWTIASPN